MKYNYVILSTDWDLYRQLYADVIGREDVCYIAGPQATKRGLEKILYRVHFNKKLNHLVSLPFKELWNHSYFTCPFKDNKPICFVLFRDWISVDAYTGYIDWLKSRYPDSKFVWFLHDIIAEHKDFYTGKVLDIERYKQKLDLVITCNPTEALQFGLSYHNVPISKLCKEGQSSRCDVLFIGKDKGRLEKLLHIYDSLTRKGASCRFFISEASNHADNHDRDGITYLERPMPYPECQAWAAESNCLLELRYDSNAGETLRASEALIFGKKLITDNPAMSGSSDFNPDGIRILSTDDGVELVDLLFMKSALEVSYEKKEFFRRRLSPLAFLNELDERLS